MIRRDNEHHPTVGAVSPMSGPAATLAVWIKTAARLLRPRGTLTMIWRADGLAEVLRALAPAFGAATVLPIHPGPEQAGDPHSRAGDQGKPRAARAAAGPRPQRPFGAPVRESCSRGRVR